MSVTAEPTPAPPQTRCAQCGASMPEDHEWCLECGTARTLIHRAPDWRIPLVIILLAIVVAGIVVAPNALSSSANSAKPAAAARVTQPPLRPAARTTASAPTRPRVLIASWPAGLGGWTVILSTDSSQAAADAGARHISATATPVGVLYSSEHRSLTPGLWVVFSGRYPTAPAAEAAARRLQGAGLPGARAHGRPAGRLSRG